MTVNINLSLFGQMITFGLFVWFTMRFVWPPIIAALAERKQTIANGLAAAEQGHRAFDDAKVQARELLVQAKQEAHHIIDEAKKRGIVIVDEAKTRARDEGDRLLQQARTVLDQERMVAKQSLYQEFSQLAVLGAEKLLGKKIDSKTNDELFQSLIKDLQANGDGK